MRERAVVEKTMKLNDGNTMPTLGLGCYLANKGDEVYNAVRWAIEAGYRMIDTAAFYGNEEDVGRAVRDSGVAREELFVVSKAWPTDYGSPKQALESSLKRLDIGYIDAYLLHWPHTDAALRYGMWEALLEACQKGDVKSPGVSNFMPDHLEDLMERFRVVPVSNQLEVHPWLHRQAPCEYCRAHDIVVTAWAPILRGRAGKDETLAELAGRYDRTPAQIALRWNLQRGNAVIPKSTNRERIRSNAAVYDFELADEDMQRINGIDKGVQLGRFDPYTFTGE